MNTRFVFLRSAAPLWACVLLLLSLNLVGCDEFRDPCKDVSCQNGGTCFDGKCSCISPYEGATCTELERQKFMGGWTVTYRGFLTENQFSNPEQFRIDTTFDVIVTGDADPRRVVLPNFLGRPGQTLLLRAVQDRLEPNNSPFYYVNFDGRDYTVKISAQSGYLRAEAIVFTLSYGAPGVDLSLREFEMIWRRRGR